MKRITLELMVTDVEETVDFYKSALGFETTASEADDQGRWYWAQMQFQDFVVAFKDEERLKAESPFMRGRSVGGAISICIHVEEINDLYASLQRRFQILDHPHLTPCGATQFSLLDNNGYVITFERFS